MRGLYIHIPFCINKCKYCDFSSFSHKNNMMDEYVNALVKEIDQYNGLDFDTVYIGGGTPTTLNKDNLKKMFDAIFKKTNIVDNSEITIETNPETVSYDLALFLRENGVNRVSMGGQSFVDSELTYIGRIHNSDKIISAYNDLKKAGFDNINIDLMYALPNQTMKTLDISIDNILQLAPAHVSCYGLKVEENTHLFKMLHNNEFAEKDDEEFAKMYYHIRDRLCDNGYEHYEISNFAKPGLASRHNSKYWLCEEYVGLGLGASSYYNGERFENSTTFEGYFMGEKEDSQILSREDKMSEFIILGLRMLKLGVDMKAFRDIFGVDIMEVYGDVITKNIDKNLLEIKEGKMLLTPDSYCICNTVMCDFI